MTAPTQPTEPTAPTEPQAAPTRRWWQRLPFVVLVAVVPVPFGLYFLAFIGIALVLGDRTRDTDTRAGAAVGLFWWAYSFREGDTTPYFSVVLLATAATLFARSAWKRRGGEAAGPVWVPALCALGAVAFGIAAFVPYGYRPVEVTRDDALRRVLAERTARPWRGIDATSYLVDRGRLRLVHTPVWYVVLYERSTGAERTLDGQPCFSRREVWRVDALDGDVTRAIYDEAHVGGDPCLPIKLGTEEDLRPVPR